MLLELYKIVADKCQVIYLEVPEAQLKTIQEQDQVTSLSQRGCRISKEVEFQQLNG